jgi:predicted alpha/beta-fold hydrolase
MIVDLIDAPALRKDTASLLDQIAADFANKPFIAARFLRQGDAQTLAAYLWPSRFRPRDLTGAEERLFEVESEARVLARCQWQEDRTEHPTLVMWHGLEGSATSPYMITTGAKAFARGFNVVRVNIRNCGGTEHLTPTLYHAGLTADLRVVIDELINRDHLPRIAIAGFSLGGNLVLKLAGELGDAAPEELKAVVAISPSVDLQASCDLLNQRRNLVYNRNFLHYLKRRMRVKKKLFPDLYDLSGMRNVRSMEQFDDHFIAPAFGFSGVRDYYAKASALPFIKRIRIPTLIIHAADDPFIPAAPLRDPSVKSNPHVLVLTPETGGHVAFVGTHVEHEDRFWAENRLVDFAERLTT